MRYRPQEIKHTHNHMGRKAEGRLRHQVLHSVMALGVAVTSWLGMADVQAEGITRVDKPNDNLMQNSKADIYAEAASGSVGLNRFQDFNVKNNEMANLYFKTSKDSQTNLDTLVNTVQNRIDIQGTVNAIRDNKIGGNLYFLSPKGMVIGAGGVINAGSLTAITMNQNDLPTTAFAAEEAIKAGSLKSSSFLDDSIVVNGQINTMTGIDLQAAAIYIGKNPSDGSEKEKALLQTGVIFNNIVNTSGQFEKAIVVDHQRLTAALSEDGKIVIADPNESFNKNLQGDGSIQIKANAIEKNSNTKFWGVENINNTAQATVDVGEGASLDALGHVVITADAKASLSENQTFHHWWDFMGFAKANATVDGKIQGADIQVKSNAVSDYNFRNYNNLGDAINQEVLQSLFNSQFSSLIFKRLNEDYGSGSLQNISNLIQQLYIPFNFTDAKATTTIGNTAQLTAAVLKDARGNPLTYKAEVDGKEVQKTVGGNVEVQAHSEAINRMAINLKPWIREDQEKTDFSHYFTGGFIYEDSQSHATVNVDGLLQAEKNVNVQAEAENTNEAGLSVSSPKVKSEEQIDAAPMVAAAVTMVYQDTSATVNMGTKNSNAKIDGAEAVSIAANSNNSLSNEAGIDTKDPTAIGATVAISNTKGNAIVNQGAAVTGGDVEIQAEHTLSDFAVSAEDNTWGEFSGIEWFINRKFFKEKVDTLNNFMGIFGEYSQEAAGDQVKEDDEEAHWNDYFNVGASIALAQAENKAQIHLRPTGHIEAKGDVSIEAHTVIEDHHVTSSNGLVNGSDDMKFGVSAAVAVENMTNTATVDGETGYSVEAEGDVSIQAQVEQKYNRYDKLVEDLKDALDDAKEQWKTASWWDRLQNIAVDLSLMREKDSAGTLKNSDKYMKKAAAGLQLVKDVTGLGSVIEALEAFTQGSSYAHMAVSAVAKNDPDGKVADTTAMAAGAIGIQNLHNNGFVNLGSNTQIKADGMVKIGAGVTESNVQLIGRSSLVPWEWSSIEGTKTGIGGSVGVQNSYNDSGVTIQNGVAIDAGSIDITSDNDVLNLGIVASGTVTSGLGITGMVSYIGGTSHADTLIDSDVDFKAHKKVEHVKKEDGNEEDQVTSTGAIAITARNNTNGINAVGNLNSSDVSAIGVSTGVISYDVRTKAQVKNLEKRSDGISVESEKTEGKLGTFSANRVTVQALTDGMINNITAAGVKTGKTENKNKEAGGVHVAADGGLAGRDSGGLEQVVLQAGNGEEADPLLKVNGAGSVSWNYVVDDTEAKLDNVAIHLTTPEIGEGVTDEALKKDLSSSVQVTAEDKSYIGAYSGAMALTKVGEKDTSRFQGTLSGAIAVNDLKKETQAVLEHTTISKEKDVTSTILNQAQNNGAQVASGLSLGLETGKRSDGASVNLGASGSVNKADSTVRATMLDNEISGGHGAVENVAYDTDIQVAGGVTAEWANATASIGAAVSINQVKNTIQAAMKNNVIGTASSYAQSVQNIAASHLIQVGSAVSVGVSKEKTSYAVGNVAVNTNDVENQVEASMEGGQIFAGRTTIKASDGKLSSEEADNGYKNIINSIDGKATTLFDLDGSDAMAHANGQNGSDFSTNVTDGNEKADYTNSRITLTNQGNTIVGTALGLGVKAGDSGKANGAGAAAASISHVKNNFNTSVKNVSITTSTSEADDAALKVIASSDTRMVGVAAGVAAEASGSQQVGLGLAGSGVKQTITNQTTATVEDSTLTTDHLLVNGKTSSSLVTVAGQVSVTTSQQGVAGGLTWAENKVNNHTGAYVRGLTLSGIDSKETSLDVLAENNANTWAVAAGSSVSLGYGAAEGAYAANHGTNNTEAIVEKSEKNKNTISNGKSISVKAADTSSEKAVAGSVAVAAGQKAMATLGGAVSYNNIGNGTNDKQHVTAKLSNAVITTADAGTVDVQAENKAKLLNLALGGAVRVGSGSIGVSGQGSVAATTLYSDTYAGMNQVTISKDKKAKQKAKVTIKAGSESQIANSADALSVSAGTEAQGAFGGAVSTIKSDADTRTELTQSQLSVKDLTAQAMSTNGILNIGIGLAVGASGTSVGASLAGNVASNKIENDTTVSVDNSTVVADDTMAVLADSQETLKNYGGAISVGASGGGGGVSLGTTIVTNTISGNTEAHVNNSNITVLGNGDGVSVNETSVDEATDKDGKTTHWVTSKDVTKKGLVINANAIHRLKDLSVTAGVGASATAGVAADATVVINTIGGKTGAVVSDTNINNGKTAAELANADVSVTAYDKADVSSHLGNVAVGAAAEAGVGAAGAGDRNTISRETLAEISGNQNVLNAHDVAVNALGETKIHVSESGVAAGGSATGAAAAVGSVSSDRFTGKTSALVSGVKGTIHSLDVEANRLANVATYNNAISLSGAIGSASVSVGVTNIEDASQTKANVSQVELATDGSQDSQVKVNAQNDIQVSTELSGDALAVSLGGAAGISVANVNIESQVDAAVDQAVLGQADKKFGDVQVTAENDISHSYKNVAVGISSLLGTAIGKGAVTINTGTSATVSHSNMYGGNITVGADEKRNIQASMVGVGAGAANVGVNVMYTNVGASLEDSYDYDRSGEGENASYDTKELQKYVNEALSRMNQQVEKAQIYDSSIEKGSTTISKGDAAKAGLTTSVSHSTLMADDKLDIHAKATTNTDIAIHQAGLGIANVAVAANRMDVEDKLHVSLSDATLWGSQVQMQSITDGTLKSYTGQGGFSGVTYADTTGYMKHGGTNMISVDDSTITSTGHPLWLQALNQAKIDNTSLNINLAGVNAGRMVLDSEDSSEVAIQLGEKSQKRNTLTASSVEVEVRNAPGVKSENKADVTPVSLVNAKGSITTAKANGKAMLHVTDKNTFDTGKEGGLVRLSALTGGQGDDYFTTEAISHTVKVSGVDITVNKARTYNGMEASTTLGAASFAHEEKDTKQTTYSDVSVGASNATTSHSYIHSVDLGIGVTSGSNFAQNYGYGKATTVIDTGRDILHVKNLDAYASNSDTVEAKANGTSAGIVSISPYLAKVENTVDTKTTMDVKGNILAEEDAYLFALRDDEYNLLANGLTVTAAGGGAAGAWNQVTNDTSMNIDRAQIVSGGGLLLDAENTTTLNRKDGFEKMVMGTGWDAVGVDTSRIDNTITSNAHVNLNQSTFFANDSVDVIGHTDEDLLVNGYVYNVSVVGGAEARVNNTITNDDRITLKDSQIKTRKAGSDITLSTADDVKLSTYGNAETATGVFTGANAIMNNAITRNNSIDMSQGANSLYSSQDIYLYAGKNADGSASLMDLDAQATDFIGGAIPVFPRPTVKNTISQNNQITIGKNSASRSVRHSDFYAASGREMANVSANRYVGVYGSSQKGAFVSTDKGETIQGKKSNNFVQVDGSAVAGVANKIDIVIGETGDVVVRDKALRDTVVGGAKDTGDISISVKADESTGLTKDSLLFGTEDYTSTLYERYQEIENLMLEYAKDGESSAAYQGYKAEAERIENELLTLGLAEKGKDGKIIPKASLAVDYVEIPELTSSGGNITVDTEDLTGSGTLKAQGTPEITITNNTNLMTKIDGITVDDAGGQFLFNGNHLTGKTIADFNQKINSINKEKKASFGTVEAAEGQSGKITITGNYNGTPISYKGDVRDDQGQKIDEVSGSMKPMANILIQGNVYAKDGDVTVKSAADSIVIQGKGVKDAVAISGARVTLDAAKGNITQGYTDGIVNIGADVKSLYDSAYKDAISKGPGTHQVDQIKTDITDGSKASGSYIAGGNVYINASDINVNGVIQSGFSDYYADISDATTKAAIDRINQSYDGQRELSDAAVTTGDQYKIIEGGAFWDAKAGCYKYKLNVYYNPSTQKILVENVDASGGQIYLTGRISSTGNGQIICLDGVSDISVKNSTSLDLKVGQLTTHDVNGLVRIQDTAKKTLTEITNGKTVVKTIDDKGRISDTGTESTFDKAKGFDYQPQEGLKYTWTSGKESTAYTKYKNDFETGGWNLKWSSSEAKTELAKWMKEHPEIQGETGSDKEAARKQGETIRIDTTSGSQVTVAHQENSEKNMTVDGTRKWSSGLWGYYKHNEVTWTESTGSRDTYDASIQADNPIHVKFIGKAAEDGKISIDSRSSVELTGDVGNTKLYETKNSDHSMSRLEKGTISIASQDGSIVQNGGSLYGSDIDLSAREDMENIQIVAGDTVHVGAIHDATGKEALEQNTIDLTINGAYQAKGNVVLGHIGSVVKDGNSYIAPKDSTGITGLVDIKTTGQEGTISQEENGFIVADRINLTSEHGSIYGQKREDGSYTALKVYAGQQPLGLDTLDASINAIAKGHISLEQTTGDMRIGQIISQEGDVNLSVSKGSVVDALPYVSNDRGDAEDLVDRWKDLGLIDGSKEMVDAKNKINQAYDKKSTTKLGDYKVWDENALLYAIQDSVVNQTSETLPKTSEKSPNVIGHNITITVSDSVGIHSGKTKEINTNTLLEKDADGSYKHLDDLKALSKADASTVTWKKDAEGNTIAVISETLPIGVQQTTKNGVAGTLTVVSSAVEGGSSQGNIFMEGREDKNSGSMLPSMIKDLYLGNISTSVGNVTLRSLGGIYNQSMGTTSLITGKMLYLSAANGSVGTLENKLTTNLFGSDKKTDGLTAVASGGIYIDQKGENNLIVRSISSGKDIVLGSDTSILMGEINGTDAVNYIRAENNGKISLEARGGNIGEAEKEEDGTLRRDTNKGVRILNSGSDNRSEVTLRAKDNVYVTGVASADGKTPTKDGKAGSLDLTIGSVGGGGMLKNIGISVDGTLHLTGDDIQSSETTSIYTTTDLEWTKSISSADTYIGSEGHVWLTSGTWEGKKLLTVEANGDIIQEGGHLLSDGDISLGTNGNILLKKGTLSAKNAKMLAMGYIDETYDNSDSSSSDQSYHLSVSDTLQVMASGKDGSDEKDYGVDLGSRYNQLSNVIMDSDNGNILLGNGGDTDLSVSVDHGQTVQGNVEIHNYKGGKTNDVIVNDSLLATGNIAIQNDEKDILVKKTDESFTDILLQGKDILLASAGSITNANGVEASGNMSFLSGKAMTNTGEVHANGNVILMTQEDTVDYNDIINTGDIYAGGDITITSADSVINWGHFQSNKKGNITMSAGDDVLNLGIMEAVDGNVELTSSDGSIYNQLGADLISGHGNVTLHAKSQNANLYYYNEEGELLKAPVGTEVHTYTEGAKKGGQYITIEGKEYDAVRDGSVFNAGDALAMGGTISFISDAGDVTNYDDFDTLVDKEGQTYSRQYNGKDIATGNVTISAEKGSLYNAKDIEAGGSISLIAKEGLQNLAYNLYAGQDITLHATSGDILNTSVLESLYGDVTLVADNGNVINGKKGTPSSGDIITLGGTVHLEAKGKDKAGNGHNVTNYGDIVAIGKTNGDKADSGSIILSSEFGDVNNYDDLSRLDDGSESYKYDKQKHISVKDLPSDVSYNVATNNIEMSAAHGKLYNDKQYLVALKDVVLTAKEGLGSYGDVILAGGNISMTDTDGDLINRANLVSMDGDISLKAEKGSVINGTKGKLVALNGNVSLEAGGDIEQNYQIYLVDEKGKQQTWTPAKDVGDRILISESYYKDEEGNKHFLSNTAPFAPEEKSVYTQISYIDDGGNRQLLQDGLVGQMEAFRKGDVVNRGDMVSIRGDNKSKAEAGNVQLKSTHGNVTNYDDFKLVDGKTDDKGQGYYDFLGSTGVAGEAGAKFNTGTAYTENKRYILSDSGIAMEAPEGYLYNDLALISHEDIFLESGKDLTIGTNFASVESDGNIAIRSNKGSVKNNSSVVSKMGNIILDGYAGVTSGTRDSLKADHGSISVVSEAGDIQMKELVAGKMAVAGTKKGNVDIRTIQGDDVILYTEDETSDISIKDNLTVKDHLVLQGNSFTLPKISRKDTSGTLLVDVNGIGGATKGYLNLDLDGDVRFTTLNVTKADVTTGGKLGIDALHVEDNAHFEAMGFTTGVYGKAPHHDSSHALYFDIGHGQGGSRGYTLKADDFYVIKENTPEGIRAIRSLRELHDWLDQAGKGAETFGKDNGDWMNLYIDGPHGQRSNGLLLHIDTYFHSLNQRWSAEDLASKLLDFKPYMGYMAHYDVPMTVYDRYNVIENDE